MGNIGVLDVIILVVAVFLVGAVLLKLAGKIGRWLDK